MCMLLECYRVSVDGNYVTLKLLLYETLGASVFVLSWLSHTFVHVALASVDGNSQVTISQTWGLHGVVHTSKG